MNLPHSANHSETIQGRLKTVVIIVIHYHVVPHLSAQYYYQRIVFYFLHLFSGRRLKKTIALLNILSRAEALISKD